MSGPVYLFVASTDRDHYRRAKRELRVSLGRATAPGAQLTWESGRADVVGQKVTIDTDGRTYGFEVPIGWIDSTNGLNRNFPECLTTGTVADVRFAWVSVPELGTREIAAIRC